MSSTHHIIWKKVRNWYRNKLLNWPFIAEVAISHHQNTTVTELSELQLDRIFTLSRLHVLDWYSLKHRWVTEQIIPCPRGLSTWVVKETICRSEQTVTASVLGFPKPGLSPFKFYFAHCHWGNTQRPKNAIIKPSTYKPKTLANRSGLWNQAK